MAIDRSKFTRTSVSQLAQADKDLNKSLGKKERSSSNGHELDEGSNLIRIYPVHPDVAARDQKATFSVPFVQTFLPAIVEEKDKNGVVLKDNKGNPKLKESVKPVYNAVIHGKKTKDLIDEYIKLANKYAKDHYKNDDERKLFMEPIYGNFGKKINGITYPSQWVIYCDKYPGANSEATPVFDRFFFKKSIKERLNVISQMESKGDPLGTDPFTDIEDGRAVSIFVNKEGGATGYYTTEFDSTTTSEVLANGRSVKVAKQFPLSDMQLEAFLIAKPLQEIYGNCAGRKNFETQLAGLELFDNKKGLGIFALPEWDAIVIELDDMYPEESTDATAADEELDHTGEDQTDDNSDEFDLMNRQELQKYAKDYKTGILVKPSLSDDDIRGKLRVWVDSSAMPEGALPGEEGYVEPEVTIDATAPVKESDDNFLAEMNAQVERVDVEEKPVEVGEPVKLSAADKLKAMRQKMAIDSLIIR